MKLKIYPDKTSTSIYIELANKSNVKYGHWLVFEKDSLNLVIK
jgi:hypothetical protein